MTRIVTDAEAAEMGGHDGPWVYGHADVVALLDTREGDIKAMESDLDACCGPLQDPAYWSPCTFHGAIAERLSQLKGES